MAARGGGLGLGDDSAGGRNQPQGLMGTKESNQRFTAHRLSRLPEAQALLCGARVGFKVATRIEAKWWFWSTSRAGAVQDLEP